MSGDEQPKSTVRWTLALLTGVLLVATLGLFVLDRHVYVPASWGSSAGVRDSPWAMITELLLISFYSAPAAIMALFILRNHPHHPIGWLLMGVGLASALVQCINEFVILANFNYPGLAGPGRAAAWLFNVIWTLPLVLYFWLFSLFPNGQLPSRRWRWVHVAIGSFAALISSAVLIQSPMRSAFSLPNPLRLDFPGRLQLYGLLYGLAVVALLVVAGGLGVLIVRRFSQAKGAERQQFKWLGLSAIVALVLLALGVIFGVFNNSVIGQWLAIYSLAILPVGVGMGVLRYRLYDIDLVIRRTLVYASLTVVLALIYFGSVILLQSLLTLVTGQSSSAVIVISTLAIAAAFFPLRNRIQSFIDRRFYRSKYDAAKTLATFAATARDETDLDRLAERLVSVVDETMQPETVQLWLAQAGK